MNGNLPGWGQRLLLLFGLLQPAAALAHPHSFIAMRSTFINQAQTLTGVHMRWTMDEMTSTDLLYDAGDTPAGSVIWKKLAAQVMANVLGQHYFSELYHQGKRVKFDNLPPEYHLSREGHKAVLDFVLPLAEPQPLTGQTFTLSTFDSSYFVDMTYKDASALALPPAMAQSCKVTLTTPNPDASWQEYARSLDKADAPPDKDLGRQFAQTVTLTCR
ncbi:hypothetical protein SGGMMB4_00480 [Sodalis glossinidius str. 'morsitans']|uniref:Exported protein n=1 Tax=Sodalis glossinidius (strain morsitans) TaxID=343509 RepID=Q2NWL2_SODGM|nr:putative exported protein [Sodalis glossinidius str. 'morsitans']CRL43816.1 hypothetical protein SGGMMB4_00480 [Sodalis glossinidius str. 'morsitans']